MAASAFLLKRWLFAFRLSGSSVVEAETSQLVSLGLVLCGFRLVRIRAIYPLQSTHVHTTRVSYIHAAPPHNYLPAPECKKAA